MSYNRPIISEIYAELHLEPGTLPFARFFDVVPELQRSGFSVVESGDVVHFEIDLPAGDVVRSLPRVRCWSVDRSRLIQLAPDSVVMNLVSPDGKYPGWKAFVDTVVEPAVRGLTKSLPSWRPLSVALNTIDRASISAAPSFRLGDYLNCGGPRIPAVLADTAAAFDYDVGRGVLLAEGRNRQLHIRGRSGEGSYVIEMNAVFHDRLEAGSDLGSALDRLHDESNTWFESLITDRMRNEVMEGTAHAISRA